MSEFRDHTPIVIDEFNGLWKRGDADSCPLNYFSDCENIQFIQGGFESRDGLDLYGDQDNPVPSAIRAYTFNKQTGQSLLVMDEDGNIYDTDYPTTVLLTFATATDFAFVAIAGRAYISPLTGATGVGIENEFVYVYLGDGTTPRKAAGAKPTDSDGALAAANSATAGNVEAGIHIFAVVYETNTGFLTAIGPDTLPTVTAPGDKKVDLSNIPVSPNSYVTKRHIIATKLIQPAFYTGDTRGYQFFFVPDGEIANNTATTLTVNFFDSELLEDASYLLDMFEELPAVAGLSTYKGRMIGWAEFDNPSLIRVSVAGEPEAWDEVDGLIIFPLDGNPVTACQEYRDVLYGFKKTKTNAWSDNGDAPSSWPITILDQGFGASLHGVIKVLDSEGVNVDFLIIVNFTGVMVFNGSFVIPELTWVIEDYWKEIDHDDFHLIQGINDSVNHKFYLVLPDGTVLLADWNNGLNSKDIRWAPWRFDVTSMKTVAIVNDELIFGGTPNE